MTDVNEAIDYPIGYDKEKTRRPVYYDTLSDLKIKNGMTLPELTSMLYGQIKVQPNVHLSILIGHRDMRWPSNAPWGVGIKFGAEVWYVRSKPRRRIGKPLRPGEIRQINVMTVPAADALSIVRDALQSMHRKEGNDSQPGHGRIIYGDPLTVNEAWCCTIRLRLKRPALAKESLPAYPRHESFGPSGVPIFGVQLYEHNGKIAMDSIKGHTARSGFHMLSSSHANIYTTTTDSKVQKCKSKRDLVSTVLVPTVVQEGSHVLNIGAALLGINVVDLATQTKYVSVERHTTAQWEIFNSNCVRMIQEGLRKKHYDTDLANDEAKRLKVAWGARMDAVDVCADLSLVGMLDMLSDEIYDGSIPDCIHRPDSIGLVMTIAVRLACFAHRFSIAKDELPTGTPNDIIAAKKVADMFESSIQPLVSTLDELPMFAIDVLIRNLLTSLEEDIHHSKQSRTSRLNNSIDPETLHSRVKDSLHCLFRHGCEICNDVMGVLPQSAGNSFYHSEFGIAKDCFDPLSFSQNESAWSMGLGVLRPMDKPDRVTTRGERLLALRRVMHATETWIRTGKYMGRLLLHTMHDGEVNGPMPAVETVRGEVAEEFEFGKKPNSEMDAVMKKNLLVPPPPGKGKVNAGRQGGSTKSKRSKEKKKAAVDAQEVSSDAKAKGKEIEVVLANNINTTAFVLGQNIFESILCNSPNFGIDELGVDAFVGCEHSYSQCSCCPRVTHILEGVATLSRFGRCNGCGRRRCVHCTQTFISELDKWDSRSDVPLPPEPVCLFCKT